MRSITKMRSMLYVSLLCATLCSCMTDTRHLAFIPIENYGWVRTDTLTFTFAPPNDMKQGGISLLLHTEDYSYENIALNITIRQDSSLLYHQQRTYLLDHSLPKKGIGHRCDYTLPVGNITFCDTLPVTLILTQCLDQFTLKGIREVGIRISPPMRQPGEPVWQADWH